MTKLLPLLKNGNIVTKHEFIFGALFFTKSGKFSWSRDNVVCKYPYFKFCSSGLIKTKRAVIAMPMRSALTKHFVIFKSLVTAWRTSRLVTVGATLAPRTFVSKW